MLPILGERASQPSLRLSRGQEVATFLLPLRRSFRPAQSNPSQVEGTLETAFNQLSIAIVFILIHSFCWGCLKYVYTYYTCTSENVVPQAVDLCVNSPSGINLRYYINVPTVQAAERLLHSKSTREEENERKSTSQFFVQRKEISLPKNVRYILYILALRQLNAVD